MVNGYQRNLLQRKSPLVHFFSWIQISLQLLTRLVHKQQQPWDDETENRNGVNFHPLLEAAAHDAAINKIQREARPKKFGIPRQRV